MANWIKAEDKLPAENKRILATVNQKGKVSVVPAWYIQNNRILSHDAPGSPTYSFSMVKAWQPFPEPYQQ